jgi:hypothetical protein
MVECTSVIVLYKKIGGMYVRKEDISKGDVGRVCRGCYIYKIIIINTLACIVSRRIQLSCMFIIRILNSCKPITIIF